MTRRRKLRLFVLFASLSIAGCDRNVSTSGLWISAAMPMTSYVNVRTEQTTGVRTRFSFPTLEIYNGSGLLVYRGDQSPEDARILRELPSSVLHLKPKLDAPKLSSVLESVPEFKSKSQEIINRDAPVIISTELEHCASCMAQEALLRESRAQLLHHSVTVLTIRISQ